MRTIDGAYNEILAADPGTAVSKHAIRKLVLDGFVPSCKIGSKYLISLDELLRYLGGEV